MRNRVNALIVAAVMAVGMGSSAYAAEDTPHVTDACGDGGVSASVGDSQAPSSPSDGYTDVAAATLSNHSGGGVTATLLLCGDSQPAEGAYSVGWNVTSRCSQRAYWDVEAPRTGSASLPERELRFAQVCTSDGEVEVVFDVELPRELAEFQGRTVTVRLPRSAVPAAGLKFFEEGTQWRGISASAGRQTVRRVATISSTGLTPPVSAWVLQDWASGDVTFVVRDPQGASRT